MGKMVALTTFSFYFTIYPEILKWIWPFFLERVPERLLYLVTIITLNLMITLAYNISMYFIYTRKYAFFEQYRISQDQWPWEKDPSEWNKLLKRSLINIPINMFICGTIITSFDLIQFSYHMGVSPDQLPTLQTNLLQFFIFLISQELLFYLAHMMLHHPKLYWIHKKHHQYNTSVSIAAEYSHPIQFVLNSIAFGLGFKLLSKFYPVHVFTIIIWATFRFIETYDGHCGYEWSWGQSTILPFCGGGKYHFFHHKQNVGNFGAILNIFDTVFNTNSQFMKYEKEEDRIKPNHSETTHPSPNTKKSQ